MADSSTNGAASPSRPGISLDVLAVAFALLAAALVRFNLFPTIKW